MTGRSGAGRSRPPKRFGFRVRELEGTYLEEARFAGPDAVRAGDLTCALTELDADLVMAMRGGYGCGRILDMLDWERIGAASTPFVGFSDVTAFELALLARTAARAGRARRSGT